MTKVYLVILQDETKCIIQERVPEPFLGKFIMDIQSTGGRTIVSVILIP